VAETKSASRTYGSRRAISGRTSFVYAWADSIVAKVLQEVVSQVWGTYHARPRAD
jgi:hypothetical protein